MMSVVMYDKHFACASFDIIFLNKNITAVSIACSI